jgi:uncharacterized protein (DUF305 family)
MLIMKKVPFHRTLSAAAVLAVLGVPAFAQTPAPPQAMSDMAKGAPMDDSASSLAFKAASDKMMHKMMQGMSTSMTGDADRDFVAGMIPHHQGAIDMAKVELQYGKDPIMRRVAQGIIKAQEKEIAEMHTWQAKHAAAR